MRGHPAGDSNADRGDLVVADPDTALPFFAGRRDSEVGDGPNQHFLQLGHILTNVAGPFAKMEDRIADDLPGTVVGDVAAARRFEKADSGGAKRLRSGQEISHIAAAPECDDGGMLEEQELIVQCVALTHLDKFLLHPHSIFIRDDAETPHLTGPHSPSYSGFG